MDANITEAVIKAADIYRIPHKNMAFAISVALNHLAEKSGGWERIRLSTLADDFSEAS